MYGAVPAKSLPIEQLNARRSPSRIAPSLWLAAENMDPLPPLLARRIAPNQYEILSGHAVWYAAQLGLRHTVPVILSDTLPDTDEPSFFQDPITEAMALSVLKDTHGLSDRALAERLRWSRKQIIDLRRLLLLDPDVQDLVRTGRLRPSLAVELVSIPANRQRVLAQQAVVGQWTLRDLRDHTHRWRTPKLHRCNSVTDALDNTPRPADSSELSIDFHASHPEPSVASLERALADLTGAPTRILDHAGEGILAFRYHNLDELEGLLQRLGWRPTSGEF